jgi:NADH:ubiquinone oxidoreductase subunit 6 (subunit J)
MHNTSIKNMTSTKLNPSSRFDVLLGQVSTRLIITIIRVLSVPLGTFPVLVTLLTTAAQTFLVMFAVSETLISMLFLPLIACVAGALIPFTSSPVVSLLLLLAVFFSTMLFYLCIGAAYYGFAFMIIYVGSVVVIFVFIILLLGPQGTRDAATPLVRFATQLFAALGVAVLFHKISKQIIAPLTEYLSHCVAKF